MAQGEQSLRLELLRRRAASATSRDGIAAPPGPVTYSAVAVLGAAALVGGAVAYLIVRARRRRATRRA